MTSQPPRSPDGETFSALGLRVEVIRPSTRLTVLRCVGEIDLINGPVLRDWIDEFAASRTVLDLTGVRFLGLSAARDLCRVQADLRARGKHLYVVASPDGAVRRILTVVGGLTLLAPRSRPAAAPGPGPAAPGATRPPG
ncbi:STAS domain-containing protein [Pseudonocardia benzenivorans]|uniref:STAS domain-containing protein n=1 Tax=Pseudonocardia benzenivorans TaxID=228005 RepID=A0ABW3VJJ3_9PSEU